MYPPSDVCCPYPWSWFTCPSFWPDWISAGSGLHHPHIGFQWTRTPAGSAGNKTSIVRSFDSVKIIPIVPLHKFFAQIWVPPESFWQCIHRFLPVRKCHPFLRQAWKFHLFRTICSMLSVPAVPQRVGPQYSGMNSCEQGISPVLLLHWYSDLQWWIHYPAIDEYNSRHHIPMSHTSLSMLYRRMNFADDKGVIVLCRSWCGCIPWSRTLRLKVERCPVYGLLFLPPGIDPLNISIRISFYHHASSEPEP